MPSQASWRSLMRRDGSSRNSVNQPPKYLQPYDTQLCCAFERMDPTPRVPLCTFETSKVKARLHSVLSFVPMRPAQSRYIDKKSASFYTCHLYCPGRILSVHFNPSAAPQYAFVSTTRLASANGGLWCEQPPRRMPRGKESTLMAQIRADEDLRQHFIAPPGLPLKFTKTCICRPVFPTEPVHYWLSLIWFATLSDSVLISFAMYPFSTERLLPRYSNISYTALRDSSPHRRLTSRPWMVFILKVLVGIAVILGLAFAIRLFYGPKLDHPRQAVGPIPTIPRDFRAVGLVFYGRRSRVEILNCYLKV